uniref:Uncharacterized protein n=1 Tax=Globodera rostochiensis TaxID=31243 RepID=A0A914HXA0_GLORO
MGVFGLLQGMKNLLRGNSIHQFFGRGFAVQCVGGRSAGAEEVFNSERFGELSELMTLKLCAVSDTTALLVEFISDISVYLEYASTSGHCYQYTMAKWLVLSSLSQRQWGQLSACFFHYTQALVLKWRSMASERRDLMALALIPVELVRKAFVSASRQLDRARYWTLHPEEAAKPSRKKYVLKEGDLFAVLDAVDYLAPGEPHVTVRSLDTR